MFGLVIVLWIAAMVAFVVAEKSERRAPGRVVGFLLLGATIVAALLALP